MTRTISRFEQLRKYFFVLALVLTMVLPCVIVSASQFISGTYNSRAYKLFIPTGYQQGTALPLVVMLHGCTQDPDQFATGTQMNALAETERFLVLYPVATSANKCFNWFDPSHQSRGSGEPALIAGMVNNVQNSYTVDSNRIYVHGLSAGGAMSVVMGATYPDVFAAIGVASGLEYKAATSMTGGFTAMSSGGPNPDTQGTAAANAMGSYKRTMPVIVFHGDNDQTVAILNGNQVVQQWAQTDDIVSDGSDNNNIDNTADRTETGTVPGGRGYTKYTYNDLQGNEWIAKYIVTGMAHAWSGGSSSGSYTDSKGPNCTQISWNFFKAHPKVATSDTIPPVTTASPNAGTYSGSVTVTLSVNEWATTYYTLDGSTPTISSAQYSGPISITSTKTLKFFSKDTAGNIEAVQTKVYTISGSSSGSTATFKSIAAEDGFVGALAADGTSTTITKVGDKGMYSTDTYRTILSFDTSSLSGATTIGDAKLRVYCKTLTGTVGTIYLDIKSGTFGTAAIEQSDYSETASASGICTIAVPASNGAYTEVTLPSAALQYINKTGRTQFRLRATSTANSASDVLEIYGGENATYAPLLTVTYK